MSKKKDEVETKTEAVELPVTCKEVVCSELLKVQMTPEEIMHEAEKIARIQFLIPKKEAEMKAAAGAYKAEIEKMMDEQTEAAELVRDKYQKRMVRCIRLLDWKTKQVTLTRTDTNEVIDLRIMRPEELQMQLAIEENKPKYEAMDETPAPVEPATGIDITKPTPEPETPIDDTLIVKAVKCIEDLGRASTSAIQRRLKIGFTQAARIMDILESRGIVGPANGNEPREVLIKPTVKVENGE